MIKFGTDGWRAIISDEFTFANVRKVASAVALYLVSHKSSKKPLIIGYDPRFLADRFAEEAAKVMEEAGIDVYLTERDTPTPVVAWEVRDKKAAGAMMLTASHNPAEYCGIKFIPDYAGPATESITNELQENSNREIELPRAARKGRIERFDPRERYIKYIMSLIDPALIKKAKLKVVYDPMYGAGRGYLDRILQKLGCEVEAIHSERDALFGGKSPEPTDENLGELKKKVVEISAHAGLANDGDADRFGAVNDKGEFLSANMIFPLIFEYLVSKKGYTGTVVRSIATTHLIDRIAARHKIRVRETPVGFKHIARIMMEDDVIIGGEESGGISIKGHIPEKDGILADLLLVEMIASYKKPLSRIWQDLISSVGEVHTERLGLKLKEGEKEEFMRRLDKDTPQELAGLRVKQVNRTDGVKMILSEGSWVLARPSGTEPLIRAYVESDKQQKLEAIVEAVRNLI